MRTVLLQDGYNGHTEVFNAKPVQINGDLVQLCLAAKPWMVKWTRIATLKEALRQQYDSSTTLTGSL